MKNKGIEVVAVLTESELRVLQLFRKERSATQKQIAVEYGKSVDTINFHLRSIRRKFNLPRASGHSLAFYAVEQNLL